MSDSGRVEQIDLLRALGLLLIILAHVSPPELIFQIRNFDVPMMLLAAGMAYAITSGRPGAEVGYWAYLSARFVRLVFPVWLFFSFYFLVCWIFPQGHRYSLREVIGCFLLIDGIGYVWVIRVFLIVAFAAPVLARISHSTPSRFWFLLAALILWAADAWVWFLRGERSVVVKALEQTLVYGVAYGLPFIVGYREISLRGQFGWRFFAFFVLNFLFAAYVYDGAVLQDFKYPPRALYISYALVIVAVLWRAADWIINFLRWCGVWSGFSFLSRNSIWIYLWHILFVECFRGLPWLSLYGLAVAGAVAMVAAQVRVVDVFCAQISVVGWARFARRVLTG